MHTVNYLLDILDLAPGIDDKRYIGQNLDIGSPAVYGGQVLAQSVKAAYNSMEEAKFLHSLHGYFLVWGNNDKPIEYRVDTIRDGYSFSTRRVTAFQDDTMIFILAASFHKGEDGVEHQEPMINVPMPESLTPFSELFAEFAEKFNIKPRGLYSDKSPLIFHPVERYNPFNPGKRAPYSHVWFKSNGKLPDDIATHHAVAAYASDFSLLISAMLPHQMSMFTTPMKIASLDHSMHIHRPFRADEWLLYAVESPSMSSSRGFCQGKIYTQDGVLVASVAQEGLIRQIKGKY
jgi:acyl-CoA thioesterase II